MASAVELSGNLCEYNAQKNKAGKERFFALENNKLNCYGKEKEQITQKKPKYSLNIQELKNIKLQQSKHDNILCIEHGEKTVFLIATKKEDINRWYGALSQLCNESQENLYESPIRDRSNTDTYVRKSVPTPRLPFSSQTLGGFTNEAIEYEAHRRPLPAVPGEGESVTHESDANASNIDINVLQELPCCVRHHVVLKHQDGRNMVDTEIQYENVHFIRNPEEWRKKIQKKKQMLDINKESYKFASQLHDLQQNNYNEQTPTSNDELSNEPIYMNTLKAPENEIRSPPPLPEKQRGRVPPKIAPKPIRKPSINRDVTNCDIDASSLLSFRCSDKRKTPEKYDVGDLVRQQGTTFTINIPKQELVKNKIKLAEINNGIWIGGFKNTCSKENKPSPYWIMFGDQLIKVNNQWLDSAKFAGNTIETTCREEVSLCVKRLPHAQIITLHREFERQKLGLECHRREVTNVYPDEIASTQGRLRPEATGIKGMNCTWTITHVNSDPIPPNITTSLMEDILRTAGDTVHLIVQPTDFVQEIMDAC